jgi:transcriptional regulator with XRE-family HTH domain
MRKKAGLSGKDLAEATGWPQSKVSRLENGKQMPTASDLETWAAAVHASKQATRQLLDLLSEAQSVHLDWKRRMSRGQTAVQTNYNQLVEQSHIIRHFETVYVPGLLQITDYARRVLHEMIDLHGLEVSDVDAAVAARMQRQQFLYDTGKTFEFLIAEPVLRWLLCPPDVMYAQLDRLLTVFGLANVRLGVIPLGVPLVTAPQNSFQIYDDLAIAETFVGETAHDETTSKAYGAVMDRLWDEALVGDDARTVIVRAAEDVRTLE